jgi:hypothetical protein
VIESMCVVCHGPVPLRVRGVTALCCHSGESYCNEMWRRMKRGEPLAWRYQQWRMLHAYRREKEGTLRFIESRIGQLREVKVS